MRWTEEQYTEYLRKNNKLPGQGLILTPVKKSKYNANRVRVDGILFDSQLEADYYSDLKLQLKMGTIRGFCRQPEFVLQEGFAATRPITYRPDFIIFHNDGTAEIIDTKGFETQEFRRTKKLFKAKFPGLELKVVKRDSNNESTHKKYYDFEDQELWD
jgi:hypothetical protein